MNSEELKNLKKELDKVKSMKYIQFDESLREVDYSEAKTKEEIIATDETDKMVHCFEELMEIGVKTLSKKGIPFDYVQVFTSAYFLVDGLYCEEYAAINNSTHLSNAEKEEKREEWFDNIKGHALTDYVCVRMVLDNEIYDRDEDVFEEFRIKGFVDRFTGVVNVEKFFSRIKDLGYIVTLDDAFNSETFKPATAAEFMSSSLDDGGETIISFIADFKEKEKNNDVIK